MKFEKAEETNRIEFRKDMLDMLTEHISSILLIYDKGGLGEEEATEICCTISRKMLSSIFYWEEQHEKDEH